MACIKSKVNPRDEDYLANYDAMASAVADLRRKTAEIKLGGGSKYQQRHLSVANYCPATVLTPCWITAVHFWNYPSWPLTACMTMMYRRQALSPALAGSAARNA